ncbi:MULTISPECIES: flagellar filament capping protein FliD [Pseudomonas syringae group]|uniref:Flagellar hook-associated protein 2 n=1 Tax=Pseudomonas syringae pv. ribicola TaxID=55398 RepID=A0A0P9YBY7_PSESI|nr:MULTISPECIES: flagellar filament capping protein FliD [Pseudomonas syringae group]EKN47689.1 flagellar hook-associated 2 domain-containing protein [Pseudomonas viridiflava UASWS0038]KPL66664.1 flagellar hook protein FliD [Pseudomonas viridiflava]KPY45582.1 Flagellar hook-associated 2 domain-containing protein [Pseudomonas syringae pv. ribicola]KPZ23891.1 Flagellar hook-associated 2 domain-containing protein [Pseudomonas viridiflava]OAG92002.1 flagellar hook protein FliD [Pseudomonas viridif
MASPITSTVGVGSGLNIAEIVKGLAGAERQPKQTQLDKQTSTTSASLSGVGQLSSALAAFQKTMDTLNSTTTLAFNGFAATSADEKVLKATAGNNAVNGTYAIAVTKLATPSKVATAALTAAQTSAIPSGTLKITQNGVAQNVEIDPGSTLEQARDKINSTLQGKGITANIINDTSGARLVFSSTTTGSGSDISVEGSSGLEMFNIDGTKKMSETATTDANGKVIGGAGAISGLAGDAEFTVDGLSLTSKTNKVSGAISGITFDLVAPSAPGATTTVTVATNTDGLKASLQSFVDSYNTLVKLVATLTKGSMGKDSAGKDVFVPAPLTGDATPRSLLAVIRTQIATSTSTSGLGSLAQLGIQTQQTDGTLSLDSAKFTAALSDKKMGSQIQALFTGEGGLLSRLDKAVKPYNDPAKGILPSKTTSLTAMQKQLTKDQADLDRRIDTLTANLTKKYNAMDLVVGQLKATASSITSIFAAMNAQKNNS